jgi:hypothetical protein
MAQFKETTLAGPFSSYITQQRKTRTNPNNTKAVFNGLVFPFDVDE